MARKFRTHKPSVQKAHELDYTWEVDGEVLRASDGWVEWGGENQDHLIDGLRRQVTGLPGEGA